MDMSQSRKPDRPKEAMASPGGGKKMKTPAMDMMASHVPMRGESAMAMKGKPVDGLGGMMGAGEMNREPMSKSEFNKRPLVNAGSYVNKSA